MPGEYGRLNVFRLICSDANTFEMIKFKIVYIYYLCILVHMILKQTDRFAKYNK